MRPVAIDAGLPGDLLGGVEIGGVRHLMTFKAKVRASQFGGPGCRIVANRALAVGKRRVFDRGDEFGHG